MAELDKPFPPGAYPLVVVGSGPGALQLSYSLRRLGVDHAVISEDSSAGGMFRRWPLFQRMLSWTKPYAPVDTQTREYERYDWNSLISDDASQRGLMTRVMDGTSYFPSRPEMEAGLCRFAESTGITVRYGCRWTSTRREDDGTFVLETSDGEYRTPIAVFAVGVAEPWLPSSPGLELAKHYAQVGTAEQYAGKRVFIVGKQNSAFEIASSLLPWARQIVLASPRPAQLSVVTKTLVGVRARYVQPFEDNVLGGGVFILDASIQKVERVEGGGFRVITASSADSMEMIFPVDEVIAATGFVTPLLDLPDNLGVATFGQSALPAQTPFWESATVPGIFFAGTITQGASGLRKHGIPSNSGAVHGHRYNARVLATEMARRHFGIEPPRPRVDPAALPPLLCAAATRSPELWHQRSYLAHAYSLDEDGAAREEGIVPLSHFVDSFPRDGAAITIEVNPAGDIYPVIYSRRGGSVAEHPLDPHPLYDFETDDHRRAAAAAIESLRPAPARA